MSTERPAAADDTRKHRKDRGANAPGRPLSGLVVGLLRPYDGWLAVVLAAMLVEIARNGV
jgi:hypothetical protein